MSAIRLATRYAKALIGLASEQNALDAVAADMRMLQAQFDESAELRTFFKSPIIKPAQKQSTAKAMYEGKVNPVTWSFIDIVIRKRREAFLREITSEFISQNNRLNKVATAKVTTAEKLSAELIEKLKGIVLAQTTGAETVDMQTEIDKDLQGGFVLQFDDKLYDASLKTKIAKLRKEFS